MIRSIIVAFVGIVTTGCLSNTATAQMVQSTVPMQSLGSGYSESTSVAWSLRGNGWFANFGGGAPAVPFGPPNAVNSGLSTGIGFRGDGISGRLRFNYSQASQRSISSTAPSITTMNGVPGSMQAGVVRPFVVGVTPVVGNYPQPVDHTAAIQQQQLSKLRHSQNQLLNKKLQQYFRRAELGASEGNVRMARANYRNAMRIAPPPLRFEIGKRLRQLDIVTSAQSEANKQR